jgi:hypothetical protein
MRMRAVARLSMICLAGVACFVVANAVMHVVQPALSPWNDAVSYYMNGAFGWVLGLGLVALGAGSLALCDALRRGLRPLPKLGIWALALWGMGAIAGGLFAPDPIGSWNRPPSLSGLIHANAAMAAFLAFPVAALRLSASVGAFGDTTAVHRLLVSLAWGSLVTLILFFACLAPVFANRPPLLLGFVERVLLLFYLGWLGVASLVLHAAGRRAAI